MVLANTLGGEVEAMLTAMSAVENDSNGQLQQNLLLANSLSASAVATERLLTFDHRGDLLTSTLHNLTGW